MQEGTYNIDNLATKLSTEIDCSIKYAGSIGKNVLICKCGVMFSVSRLSTSDDWSWARERHDREKTPH